MGNIDLGARKPPRPGEVGSTWPSDVRPPGTVHFCPFCGSGTLLLAGDKYIFTCMKCKRGFSVGEQEPQFP